MEERIVMIKFLACVLLLILFCLFYVYLGVLGGIYLSVGWLFRLF